MREKKDTEAGSELAAIRIYRYIPWDKDERKDRQSTAYAHFFELSRRWRLRVRYGSN